MEINFAGMKVSAVVCGMELMIDVMNKAALALMLSVGHRTKLFDVMAALPASTSQEIASSANLNERYVREWLGTLVTSKIIECNGFQLWHMLKIILWIVLKKVVVFHTNCSKDFIR